MNRKLVGLLIITIVFGTPFFVLKVDEPAQLWYEGGTLHQSSVTEWRSGAARDQLATAADWVTAFEGFGAPEEVWAKANRLRDCINNTVVSSPSATQTHAIATVCHSN